jgi:hypothetical protein
MGHACTHDHEPDPHEHPVVAVIAIVAIVAAMLLIAWARFAVHGTEDIEEALATDTEITGDLPVAPRAEPKPVEEQEVDAAVTSSRFATGFGH